MLRNRTTAFFYILLGLTATLILVLINYAVLRQNSSLNQLSAHIGPNHFAWYVGLTLATAVIFGANTAFLTYQARRYGIKNMFSHSGSGVGAVLGIIASSCPVCGTTLLSIVGVIGSLSSLPLQGLELKAIAFFLVVGSFLFSVWWDRRPRTTTTSCPVLRETAVTPRDYAIAIPLFLLVMVMSYAFIATEVSSTARAAQAPHSCQADEINDL